ncbi:MAG: hypothetical protein ACRENG_07455 [bacterium]
MWQQKRFIVAALTGLLASTVALWWACDFQKVSPTDAVTTEVSDIVGAYGSRATLSNIKIITILEKLAYCRTQAEADTAVRLILEKTGVRKPNTPMPPNPQSKYEVFVLSDEDRAKLAAWHLRYVTGKDTLTVEGKLLKLDTLTIGETYNAIKGAADYIDQEFKLKDDMDKTLKKLQQEATKALRDPEKPENALLVAVVAQGATIPVTIPVYKTTTLCSPIQHFLLSLWITIEYGQLKSIPGRIKVRELCILRCLPRFFIDLFFCQFELVQQKKEECVRQDALNFRECLGSCLHDQGGGGN